MAKEKHCEGILGVGLDGEDGHVRVTRSKVFHLVGGSEETHERMQESSIKFEEKLDKRGKPLGELEKKELHDLAAECDIRLSEIRLGVKPQERS